MNSTLIVQNKRELMGFAIVWIFLFHSEFAKGIPIIEEFIGFGSHGVDIFLFLSAVGLAYSLQKNPSIKSFYNRRFVRIVPTLFLFLVVVHLLGVKVGWPHPKSLIQGVCWYTTFGWWINGYVDNPYDYFYEWYIPTLLVFYAVAPFLQKQRPYFLMSLTLIGMLFSLLVSYNNILSNYYWSIQRIPIFISGFLFVEIVDRIKLYHLFCCLGGAILLLFLYININLNAILSLSIIRCGLVFVMPLTLYLLSMLIKSIPLLKYSFGFIGGLSLELYLLHIYNRPLFYVRHFLVSNDYASIILTFILLLIVAFLIQIIVNYFVKLYI